MSLLPSINKFDHGGYYQPSNDLLAFYCIIPKNASSWISEVMVNSGWLEATIETCFSHDQNWEERYHQHKMFPVVDNLIVVLRDPVERWIAGIAQYISGYILNSHWYDRDQFSHGYTGQYIVGKSNFLEGVITGEQFVKNYNPVVERLLFDQIAFDDHTQSQSWFVNYYKTKTHTWFYLNHNFQDIFLHHFRDVNFRDAQATNYNRGDDNPDIRIITNFLRKQIVEKPYLRHNIERYYKDDYELLAQANFVYYSDEEIKKSLK